METLSVGMYVKTLNGIVKIDKIKDSIMIDTKGKTHFGDFIKASHNIIDLIEVGDYVNGHRVEEIDFENEEIFTDSEYYCGIVEFNNVKSVITHEQMEQMAYKVGE